MRFVTRSVVAVAAAFAISGCATILNDETQGVNVVSSNSKPIQGNINGVPFTGPGIVQVKRSKENKIVMVETPGCVKTTALNRSVDPVFFINVLSGGAFGSTTDYSTEKMWKYEESVVIQCN